MQLSKTEKQALSRVYLGGAEALRTKTHHTAPNTIGALMRKGMFDRNGLTAQGREIAKQFADSGII